MSTTLAACGDAGTPTLNWYVNPEGVETLQAVAEGCSTDDFKIAVQQLPSSATDQRTQLARRLAARDSSTDLMSLDPVYVPEFASAGWLHELPDKYATEAGSDDLLAGALDAITWDGKPVAFSQWANTQVLWYRKSLAQAAGLDMTQPVTWDQVIQAAADNNGSVGVQANKYEGYVVWLNSLIEGAGGTIVDDTEAGAKAKVTIDSDAGRDAAKVIETLADSPARQADLSVSNEGTSLGRMFPADPAAPQGAGEFMVNWTFVYKNYEPGDGKDTTAEQFDDLGWARYPQTVAGEESRPPLGGIEIGVGAYTDHPDYALQAAECLTSAESQVKYALEIGWMPSRASAYDSAELRDAYPADLLTLFRESIDNAGTRPKTAFYNTISSALQARWHPASAVDDDTPARSAKFVEDILEGRSLL
ncbi:extracellular solute-binding protein [Nocardioides sp. NPDC126508]